MFSSPFNNIRPGLQWKWRNWCWMQPPIRSRCLASVSKSFNSWVLSSFAIEEPNKVQKHTNITKDLNNRHNLLKGKLKRFLRYVSFFILKSIMGIDSIIFAVRFSKRIFYYDSFHNDNSEQVKGNYELEWACKLFKIFLNNNVNFL